MQEAEMLDAKMSTNRREFLGGVAATAAVAGLGAALPVASAAAQAADSGTDFTRWLDTITGRHMQVYDAPDPNNGMVLIYAWAFLSTAPQAYGVAESDVGVVVVLRRFGIPIAFNDQTWAKYKLGEVFKVNDPGTKAPATRNPFAYVKPGDLPIPDAALEKLVARNVKFGVCNLALTSLSGQVAQKMAMKPEDVKKDWIAGMFPGLQVVPSGVVAINGAQARGCSYCFAG
jgi:intracellular sulfur oxidation DsrE/DsrF family protein